MDFESMRSGVARSDARDGVPRSRTSTEENPSGRQEKWQETTTTIAITTTRKRRVVVIPGGWIFKGRARLVSGTALFISAQNRLHPGHFSADELGMGL